MNIKRFRYVMFALIIIFSLYVFSFAASDKVTTAHPWTDRSILDSSERFQFVIIADVTGGRRPEIFEQALEKLKLLQPSFVMCIGDLTEGYTTDTILIRQQRDSFKEEVDSLPMRFYFLPGNHDISNSVMAEEWKQRYGVPYYHFVYRNVLFLCLDTEDPPATQISAEQVQYVRKTLADNKNVRWTFVFMHKPMWVEQEGKNPNWQAIATMLADRPHTIFAGHYHRYAYYKRDGYESIVLSTTGGVSQVRGAGLGEFDSIVWVTMTEKNPVIANLELSGILPKDVVTEDIAKVNESLFNAEYLQTDGVVSKEQIFKEGTCELTFVNKQSCPLKIEANFAEHAYVRAEPASFQLDLLVEASQKVSVKVIALKPIELYEMEPLVLELSATYQLPGRRSVTVSSQRLLDIHGASEGPELIRNGVFSGNGDPWFTWMHTPKNGTVSVSDGELKVELKKSEAWWDAGIGQSVGQLKAGGRYKVAFKAANTGGNGVIHFQVSKEGQNDPVTVIINGQPNQDERIVVGKTMEKHTVEFVVPRDTDIAKAKLIFCLGDLRDASIDDVSLREVVGEQPAK